MGSQVHNKRTRHVLGQNLRAILNANEMSENELARRSGVSQKQVNNTARERTGVGVELVAEMAKTLHVPAYQLLIPGRFEADNMVEASKLDSLIVAYLNATPAERAKIDAALKKTDVSVRTKKD